MFPQVQVKLDSPLKTRWKFEWKFTEKRRGGLELVVEVTLNRAEYGSHWSDQPENVNFELIRGLKSDIFD